MSIRNCALLEQGIPCNGPATRSGCTARCPTAGAQCIGCYGPAEGVVDFGARLMTAFASVIDSNDPVEIKRIVRYSPRSCRPALPIQPGGFITPSEQTSLAGRQGGKMTQRITIDPITRLEGHGKIEIFLNDDGDVANTYFQIPELRGFERFCVGRPIEEMALSDQPYLRCLPGSASYGSCQGCRCSLQSPNTHHCKKAARTTLYGFLCCRSHYAFLCSGWTRLHCWPGCSCC